jgi:hypothetical protein
MNRALLDLDIAVDAAKASHEFIVVSRDVNHARALACFAQNFLDYVIMLLRPINSATQRLNIDQIADDVERAEIILAQKVQQRSCVATACAQMCVCDPRRTIAPRREQVLGGLAKRKSRLSCERSR